MADVVNKEEQRHTQEEAIRREGEKMRRGERRRELRGRIRERRQKSAQDQLILLTDRVLPDQLIHFRVA